jgi:DNA-binding transcriptional MerR regulator
MPDYAPADAARALGLAVETLRKYAREFAPLLSEGAQARRKGGRRYTEDDMTVLRHAGMLLDQGRTYAQVLAELGGNAPTVEQQADERPTVGDVTVIQRSDEAATLRTMMAAIEQIVASQHQHIETQKRLIAQLQQQSEYDRAALDRARADEARALAELRGALGKIPRWLRALLGLAG